MNILRSSLKLLGSKVTTAVLWFVGYGFFARKLDADTLGTFFLFQLVLTVLVMFGDAGIRGAVEKRLSEATDASSFISSALVIKFGLDVVVVSVVVLLSEPLEAYLGAQLVLDLLALYLVQSFGMFFIRVLRGELRVGETAVLEAFPRVAGILVGIVLVSLGAGVRGIIYGYLFGHSVAAVAAFVRKGTPLGSPSIDRMRSLVDFGRYDMVNAVGSYAYNWTDVAVIGFLMTNAAVTAYEFAWRVTLPVMFVSSALATTLFPQMSHWDALGERDRFEPLLERAFLAGMAVSIPVFFGGLVLADDVLTQFFGPQYTIAATALVVLSVDKIIGTMTTVLGQTLRALDAPAVVARATLVSAGVNLLLNLALVWYAGLVGAAVATTAGIAVTLLLLWRELNHRVAASFPWRETLHITVASAVMAGVVWGFQTVYPVDSFVSLFLVITSGVAVFGATVSISPSVRDQLIGPAVSRIYGNVG